MCARACESEGVGVKERECVCMCLCVGVCDYPEDEVGYLETP